MAGLSFRSGGICAVMTSKRKPQRHRRLSLVMIQTPITRNPHQIPVWIAPPCKLVALYRRCCCLLFLTAVPCCTLPTTDVPIIITKRTKPPNTVAIFLFDEGHYLTYTSFVAWPPATSHIGGIILSIRRVRSNSFYYRSEEVGNIECRPRKISWQYPIFVEIMTNICNKSAAHNSAISLITQPDH